MRKRFVGTVPTRVWMCVLAVCIAFGSTFMAETTYSWFFYAGQSDSKTLAGRVSYSGSGAFIADTQENDDSSYIYPGRELILKPPAIEKTSFPTITNHSSIETNARVRITAEIRDYDEGESSKVSLIREATTNPAIWTVGTMDTSVSPTKMIPLFVIKFSEKGAGEGVGYSWKEVPKKESSHAMEWELVPQGKLLSEAVIKIPGAIESGDVYQVLDSFMVSPYLATVEDEIIFTNLYSGKKVNLKIEYLAKQNVALQWNVFYETEINI